MKRLNRKGYLTIEIILGAAIAFVIAFFLIEITTKMVSDTENIYRDTKLTTDIALIISGVKGEIENSGTSIKEIKCEESNSCNISFIDGVNGKLYIKDGKVIYTENDVIQYERELDSSLSSVALTSSVNGKPDDEDNIYFKISGENIYIDKVYDIIIPITTSIGPIGHPPAISCPRKNDSNTKPWTNEPGKGQVDVIVKDEDGDFTELCYYNYSKDLNNYDYAKPICIKNGNKEKENIISITNAITNMIKVQAKDQGGNTSGYTECATNIDIVKPFTPFASFLRNNDGTYNVAEMTNIKEIVSNNCCYLDEEWDDHCEGSNLSMRTIDDQECLYSYKTITAGRSLTEYFPVYEDQGEYRESLEKISNEISGVSGVYKISEICYKNTSVVAKDEYLWEDDHVPKCNGKDWNKKIDVIYDKAGNVSSKLIVNSKLEK